MPLALPMEDPHLGGQADGSLGQSPVPPPASRVLGTAEEPRPQRWPLHVHSEQTDASSLWDLGPQGVLGTQEEKDPRWARTHRCHSTGTSGAAGTLRRAETGNISYAQTLVNDLANGSFPSLFKPERILFVNGKVSS